MANAVIEGKQGESMEVAEEVVEEATEPTDMEEVVATEETPAEEVAEVEKPKRTRKKATTEEVAE